MAQADPDFDWTTAQPVEEDETSATLTATTFGQRSMPAPTQGPVNIDTEFDWKTATLDEPFDPATAQPISEQEEQQFYQDLETASRDPQRILTNTEHSLLYDHRQQQDDAVARFFQGAEDVPGNLLSLGMDAGTELRENWLENMFRPDRFAARNLATGMEIGRKAGVQLLQLVNWGQNKVADTIQRGNANDAKMREIAATVPKTGDERVDGDNVMAAIAKARDEGVFEETPFGPDKEQDYERYLQQNSYARSHAGNITEATMGGKTMTFPNEQTTVLGQQPMQAVSTIGAMGLDITNALPMGAGIFSKLRVLRRLSRVTGMPLPAVERGLAGVADGMEDFGSRVAARVTDKTGLSKTQQVASLAAVSGGAGLLAANTDGMDGVLLPVAAVSGIVPAYKLVGGTIRKTSQAAGTGAMVLREMRAGNIGVVRQAAADDLLRTGTVPPQYAAYMRPYANGVESTLGRVAKNPDNPEITRKLARLADGSGVTQAVRFADDAVSSGIAATLASTPFALLAPDAEQAGAIVGGAATLGTFAGPFAGAFGRSSSRKDADIARMLIDVHAVNGDVPALISLGRDRLGQIAGMQGVVAGKTDFVTLRASDYRANVDVRATGNETGAGVFIERASNGTARIFINVGEPASMDGKVRVRDRGDGVREVRVRGNDGRTEFIAAPKGRRLLVNDGDTVKAGQQVVDYMPPSRSMPHEIAHAILTSDILDGDIRTDMRNYVTQVYGEDGIKARGREYMAQIVDGDIMFGTHEGAVALTPEEVADVRSGKRTMSDVMKGKPVEAAERDALIDARIDEYNQRSREKGGNDYDWARDEVTAEQFAGEAKGIDFRGIRAGGPKVLESALATSARVLEVLGAKFDRTTGKPLDNPSVLFRDNPLFQSPVLRKRMIEHVRAYNDLLAGLEDAGKRETRGTKVSVDGTPDSAARSPHTKMRPDPDKGGQVGNEFLYVDETGKTQWRSPSEVRAREGSRTSQANTMYNPSRILAPNSTEFGRRTTDSGRTIVSGPTLPAQFDHFVHFPKWMREFARVLEASRERGMTFIADYNAIGDGKDGVYRVRNRGDIRAIQREVAFVGWELTGNKHLKTVLMDLNAFRASAMKAINKGELGIFNNDMQVIEADLRTYLGNHRNGLPGEAGIGQAKRDMLNGLIGTGTAVQRKANPLFSDLNPRGSVRSFRLDRYNDLTPTGREGLSFDYDKINNNRMPQQIPREAQGMPDAAASGRGDGMPDRKSLQQRAKDLGLPATGTTKEIARMVGIGEKSPYEWTREEFNEIAPHLSVHQDIRPGSDARAQQIMERGLQSGMVDSVGAWGRNHTWAGGKMAGDNAYLFVSSKLKYRPGNLNPWLDEGNIPIARIKTKPGQTDIYEALIASRPQATPSASPRAQAMPDSLESVPTDQLQRQYEENQGYLGLSTLGMREGRPVRGGAAQTRELLRRNEAISAELERRGVRQEDPQLRRALQRRGQAMPDAVHGDNTPLPTQVPDRGFYIIGTKPTADGRVLEYHLDPATTIQPRVADIESIRGEQVAMLEADRHNTRGDNMGGPLHPFLISNQTIARLLDGRGFKAVWANMNSAFVTRAKNIVKNTTAGHALIQIMKENAHRSNRKFVMDVTSEIDARRANMTSEQADFLHVLLELGAINPQGRINQAYSRIKRASDAALEGEATMAEVAQAQRDYDQTFDKYQPMVEFLNRLSPLKSHATRGRSKEFAGEFASVISKHGSSPWYSSMASKYRNTKFVDEAARFSFKQRGAAMDRITGIPFAPDVKAMLKNSMDFVNGQNLDVVGVVQLSKDMDAFAVYFGKNPKEEAKMSANERMLRDQFLASGTFKAHPSYDWVMLGPENADSFILDAPADPLKLFPDYAKNHPNPKVKKGSKETVVGTMKKSKIPLVLK
jgi:hypothetical protein